LARSTQTNRIAWQASVSPGETAVILRLRPAASIFVRLLDSSGSSLADATAFITKIDGALCTVVGGLNSDSRGIVELSSPAGQIEVRANKDKLVGRGTVVVTPAARPHSRSN